MAEKRDASGIRMCDQVNCDQPATHTFIWTDAWHSNCFLHTAGMLNLAEHMSYPVPKLSLKPLTLEKMTGIKIEEGAKPDG